MYVSAIADLARFPRAVRHQVRMAWRWRKRHPVWAVVVAVLASQVLILTLGAASTAFADSGNTLLRGFDVTDSHGIPISAYSNLALDRGDAWTMGKSLWAAIADFVWGLYISGLGVVLRLFSWLLSFEWVNWILDPVVGIMSTVQSLLAQLGWVPFALLISAAVGGVVVMTGRSVAGWSDIALSALIAALAVGVWATPWTTLQGDDGAINQAAEFGDEFAAAALGDEDTTQTTDALTSSIVDLLIRVPAQEVTFGHVLDGDCAAKFDEAMQKEAPASGNNTVRDAVSGCDDSAKDYVENPSAWLPISISFAQIGAYGVMLLIAVVSGLLIVSVIWSAFASVKVWLFLHIAILPGTGRSSLGRAAVGLGLAVASIAIVLMGSVGVLSLTVDLMESMSTAIDEIPLFALSGLTTLIVTFFAILLIVVVARMRKRGRSIGEMFGRMGLGSRGASPAPAGAMKITQQATRLAVKSMPRKVSSAAPPAGAPAPSAPVPAPAPVSAAAGSVAATAGPTNPVPAGPRNDHGDSDGTGKVGAPVQPVKPPSGAGAAKKAAQAVRIVKSAKAGWVGVGVEATRMAGEHAVNQRRGARSDTTTSSSVPRRATPAQPGADRGARATPFIEVGESGTGRVRGTEQGSARISSRPATIPAPVRPVAVASSTRRPKVQGGAGPRAAAKSSDRAARLRQQLERAASQKGQ